MAKKIILPEFKYPIAYCIAGVDEVGRGPLAADVVAAAVILDPDNPIEGLNDSKKLTEKKRERLFDEIKEKYNSVNIDYFQSNIEGELIDKLHEVGFSYDGIILNAAAYTHTSVGIGDAVKAIETATVEVHISNTFGREEFRHQSFVSPNSRGVILGFGLQSYELAIQSFL